jgi:hypothetical protein
MSRSSEKTLITKLNNLIAKGEKYKIIEWLDMLKIYNITDGKIPHLFGNTKIQIETESVSGTYNVILVWLKNNTEHFKDYDFKDIPDSKQTKASDIIDNAGSVGPAGSAGSKTFKTKEDVKRWKENPTIHPINNTQMNPVGEMYYKIYKTAYRILSKSNVPSYYMEDLLPDNHLLFGNIDLLYYHQSNKTFNETEQICKILSDNNDFTKQNVNSILETEIELLKNLVNKEKDSISRISNFEIIKKYFEDHMNNMISTLLSSTFNFNSHTIYNIINHTGITNINDFIIFIENNKLNNGMKIIDYIKQYEAGINWKVTFLELYDRYKLLYDDIDKLLDKNSGVVENYENKQFKIIPDPIDKYFIEFEKELEPLKDPKFSKLIDLTTFVPVNTSIFLNNEQLKAFDIIYEEKAIEYDKQKIEYDKQKIEYDKQKIEYDKQKIEYDKQKKSPKTSKSPKLPKRPEPPERPIIKYGKDDNLIYIYGNKKPVHIPNELLKKFKDEYKRLKNTITAYNKVKNKSYKDLVQDVKHKSSSSPELFKMNRQQINDTVLNDYSDLEDKCNNRIDILTTNELADENYPLAKLQLMVRLKMNKKTECVYAPALYNYLVSCVNNKTPFRNPITNQIYTDEHIKQLMKIMKIVDPNIEIPKYLKPINDTKLMIHHKVLDPVYIDPYKDNENFTGWDDISEVFFYEIYIYRQFGDKKYTIYKVCTIPANVEPTGVFFATGDNSLTSSTMVYKIIKLFNDGRLLSNYVPPYYSNNQYSDLGIHFNRYKTYNPWFFDNATGKFLSKTEFINLFKHYAQEINNYM